MSRREPVTMQEWYEYFCELREKHYKEYQQCGENRYYTLYEKYDRITEAFVGYFKWEEKVRKMNNTTI